MVFPTNYSVQNMAGGSVDDVESTAGHPRELLVDATNWELRLMDGVTVGGYRLVGETNVYEFLQNPASIKYGNATIVEIADPSDPSPPTTQTEQRTWSAIAMKTLFEKFMDTTDEANWFIQDGGLPNRLKATTPEIGDANNATNTGFFWANPSTALNLPLALPVINDNSVPIMVVRIDADNLLQVLYSRNGDTKFWTRTRLAGVWQTWLLAAGDITADLSTKVSKTGDNMIGPLDMGNYALTNVGRINETGGFPWNYIINGNFDLWDYLGLSPALWNVSGSDPTLTRAGPNRFNLYWEGTFSVLTPTRINPGPSSGIQGRPPNAWQIDTTCSGTGSFMYWSQVVEELREFNNGKATITFWARATTPTKATLIVDCFGVTGLASSTFDKRQIDLTTQWTKYSYVIDIPTLTGAVLASYHGMRITCYPIVGTLKAAELGVTAHGVGSNIAYSFARVSINKGSWPNSIDAFRDRPIQLERMLASRYEYLFRAAGTLLYGIGLCRTVNTLDIVVPLPARTYKIPTIIHSDLTDFTLSPTGGSPTSIAILGAGYYTDMIDQIAIRFTFASLAVSTVAGILVNDGAYIGFINPEYK